LERDVATIGDEDAFPEPCDSYDDEKGLVNDRLRVYRADVDAVTVGVCQWRTHIIFGTLVDRIDEYGGLGQREKKDTLKAGLSLTLRDDRH
jgi:hypothetical protein